MNYILGIVLVFVGIGAGLAGIAYLTYRRVLRRAKGIERGLKMVPILIHLPPPSDDTSAGSRDVRDVMREKVAQAEVLYNLIAGTATTGFKSDFYGQRHISFELIASGGLIHFYAAVPVALVSVVEKAVLTAYPGSKLEEVEDHNLFSPTGKMAGTVGGELVLKEKFAYPISTYHTLERDPMEALINALSAMGKGEGAGVQILIRPADSSWTKQSAEESRKKRHLKKQVGFTPQRMVMAAANVDPNDSKYHVPATKLEEEAAAAIEQKSLHPGYETLVRVLASSDSAAKSDAILRNIITAFALYDAPNLNGFKFIPAGHIDGLVTAFIFRFFPPEVTSNILNSEELATLFHLPDHQFMPSMQVERQTSKQVDGPSTLPQTGLLLGYNSFRGVRKEIRLSPEDRRRHTYIVGQTGTGKSTVLENLAVQDMLAGNGFAFIDPHGDTAERLVSMVPKNRVEDIIYFNPGDTEFPLGLNLFEYSTPDQKDFLIQEAIGMLYKLYDPGHTGIIGPRYEHWFRNAALTLMSDPNGSTFIEVPKVFTDTEYLKRKFKYVSDQTVIDFWTKEMGQTSDYHKSEMLGWFVSKFGAFTSNEMMRNIIGQTKSAFDLRDIMDNNKILIVNLSKGKLGELNSQLLGMMLVIKFQAAAMSRANVTEDQRPDFALYVDEFQNFSTDSFASILSEARKYRLNLIVANQFIGQLTPEIRDAVFGNVGTIVSYRTGPEDAEFLVKQFAPLFDARDIVNLPNYNAIIKLMIGGMPSQPFSINALPPLGMANKELGLAIKQLSAAKFGTSKAVAESDISARMSGAPLRPSIASLTSQPVMPAAAAPVAQPAAVPAPLPVTSAAPALVQPTALPPVPDVVTPAPVAAAVTAPAPVVDIPAPVPVAAAPVLAAVAATPVAAVAPDPNRLNLSDITRGMPEPVKPAPTIESAQPGSDMVSEAQSEINALLMSAASAPAATPNDGWPDEIPHVAEPAAADVGVAESASSLPAETVTSQPSPPPAPIAMQDDRPAATIHLAPVEVPKDPEPKPPAAAPEPLPASVTSVNQPVAVVPRPQPAVPAPAPIAPKPEPVPANPTSVVPVATPATVEVARIAEPVKPVAPVVPVPTPVPAAEKAVAVEKPSPVPVIAPQPVEPTKPPEPVAAKPAPVQVPQPVPAPMPAPMPVPVPTPAPAHIEPPAPKPAPVPAPVFSAPVVPTPASIAPPLVATAISPAPEPVMVKPVVAAPSPELPKIPRLSDTVVAPGAGMPDLIVDKAPLASTETSHAAPKESLIKPIRTEVTEEDTAETKRQLSTLSGQISQHVVAEKEEGKVDVPTLAPAVEGKRHYVEHATTAKKEDYGFMPAADQPDEPEAQPQQSVNEATFATSGNRKKVIMPLHQDLVDHQLEAEVEAAKQEVAAQVQREQMETAHEEKPKHHLFGPIQTMFGPIMADDKPEETPVVEKSPKPEPAPVASEQPVPAPAANKPDPSTVAPSLPQASASAPVSPPPIKQASEQPVKEPAPDLKPTAPAIAPEPMPAARQSPPVPVDPKGLADNQASPATVAAAQDAAKIIENHENGGAAKLGDKQQHQENPHKNQEKPAELPPTEAKKTDDDKHHHGHLRGRLKNIAAKIEKTIDTEINGEPVLDSEHKKPEELIKVEEVKVNTDILTAGEELSDAPPPPPPAPEPVKETEDHKPSSEMEVNESGDIVEAGSAAREAETKDAAAKQASREQKHDDVEKTARPGDAKLVMPQPKSSEESKADAKPNKAAPVAPEKPAHPKLAPGEVYVDDDGNVLVGE